MKQAEYCSGVHAGGPKVAYAVYNGYWLCYDCYTSLKGGQQLTKPEVPHYQATKHEPIDVIHEWQKTVPAEIRFEFGCMVKYLGRLGKKESATVKEDLEKIKNYAEFALQQLAKQE